MSENTVLCGANSYEQKYYFNNEYDRLPEQIKRELQIMCVTFTENVGGTLLVEFDKDGQLKLTVQVDDSDYYYDEIESGIQISRLQKEKEELFGQLELFNKVINGK
ncbi:MAG: hypothetical protein KBS51_04865 [Lachnospiraceae bacterium]|nr:hypothetical protein [Candidatus Darwinimomas equi]